TRARIELFDASGLKVATIYDAQIKANELYKIEYVPAANIIPGSILFYRLTLDDNVINGKVIYTPR
ncbi:MAG: hypothetical protein Q8909_14615, partial [Bacteroidota bacterium]|nr:hypothetical protein [Bacteroidota bacterium]